MPSAGLGARVRVRAQRRVNCKPTVLRRLRTITCDKSSFSAAGSRQRGVVLMVALIVLNVAAELVSFSRVIERVPPLRWLDHLGRRSDPPSSDPPSAS